MTFVREWSAALAFLCALVVWVIAQEIRLRWGAAMTEDDIVEVVDEFVDTLDPDRMEREADRLGIDRDELFDRVVNEVKARWEGE